VQFGGESMKLVSSTGNGTCVENRVILGLRKVRAISLPASVVGAKPRTYWPGVSERWDGTWVIYPKAHTVADKALNG
jgi:hypothetical protein